MQVYVARCRPEQQTIQVYIRDQCTRLDALQRYRVSKVYIIAYMPASLLEQRKAWLQTLARCTHRSLSLDPLHGLRNVNLLKLR